MPEDPGHLFVYGTLQPSMAGEGTNLVRHLETAGRATVRGILYDLGPYPGLVPGDDLAPGDDIVHGELLRLSAPEDLTRLDAFEECNGSPPLYRRELTQAFREDGQIMPAWVYVYARSVEGAKRVPGGDYRRWLCPP